MSFELVPFEQVTKNRVAVKTISAKNSSEKFLIAESAENEERK
ncbi:hypothetical protein ACFFHH_12320 [Cytobacillus solani]|nr:hypothetical protein [Cytobacillus solani]